MLAVLALVAAYYVYDLFGPEGGPATVSSPVSTPGTPPISNNQVTRQVTPAKASVIPGEGTILASFDGDWKRDPFFNQDFADYLRGSDEDVTEIDEGDSSFVLTGIIDDWVIIGGEDYQIGDEIRGMALAEIREDHVILMRGNIEVTLYLGGKKKGE